MKRLIAVLLSAGMIISLCGCVSQGDYDTLQTNYNELQTNYNELNSNYESLQTEKDNLQTDYDALEATASAAEEENAKYEQYSDVIDSLEAEDYDAVISYATDKQTEKDVSEKGDIDNYLVTVDLTVDNFEDYFKLVPFNQYNDFNEVTDFGGYAYVSSVYDEGLIVYSADDVVIEYTVPAESGNFTWTINGYGCDLSLLSGTSTNMEAERPQITRITGTITYIKTDYIDSYEVEDEVNNAWCQGKYATITLLNGEIINRNVYFDYLY